MHRLFRRSSAFVGFTTALLCVAQAHGLNRVTLRNGFSYDCARQQTIDPTHTRLFLSGDTDSSYVDIPTTEIVGVDVLPSPPPSSKAGADSTRHAPADVATLLNTAGSAHNIDVELLASLVHAESNGRVGAVSHTGARGLMQLMPSTAQSLGVIDAFKPDQNINGGTTYLDWLLTRYHDNLALALAAYNAGPGAVDHFHGIPPYRETRAYVIRVMTEFKCRKEALSRKGAPVLKASR